MLLSEIEIAERLVTTNEAERLVVTPIINAGHQFGPSSLDVRLGTDFSLLENLNLSHLDTSQDPEQLQRNIRAYTRTVTLAADQPYYLHPNEFVLASTLEFIKLPADLAGRIEGRSSWGRLGLVVHATAGYIDPGFSGFLTFELLNLGRIPIKLRPRLRVGQICFFKMSLATKIPYGSKQLSKYQGAMGVEVSRVAEDPETGKL
jgi:dCTP deaminase